jgi:hypothetical protein
MKIFRRPEPLPDTRSNIAEIYRRKVERLPEALNRPGDWQETTTCVKSRA